MRMWHKDLRQCLENSGDRTCSIGFLFSYNRNASTEQICSVLEQQKSWWQIVTPFLPKSETRSTKSETTPEIGFRISDGVALITSFTQSLHRSVPGQTGNGFASSGFHGQFPFRIRRLKGENDASRAVDYGPESIIAKSGSYILGRSA